MPARHALDPDEIVWAEIGNAGCVERDHFERIVNAMAGARQPLVLFVHQL